VGLMKSALLKWLVGWLSDGWLDGCFDGWLDGCDGMSDGWLDSCFNGWLDGCDGMSDGWLDGCFDGWLDGWDGMSDGWLMDLLFRRPRRRFFDANGLAVPPAAREVL